MQATLASIAGVCVCEASHCSLSGGPLLETPVRFRLLTALSTRPPSFTLNCTSSHSPPTTVTWTRNGETLNSNSPYSISRVLGNATSTIDLQQPADCAGKPGWGVLLYCCQRQRITLCRPQCCRYVNSKCCSASGCSLLSNCTESILRLEHWQCYVYCNCQYRPQQ